MTPEQRCAELANFLAAGVIRLFEHRHRPAHPMPKNARDSGDSRLFWHSRSGLSGGWLN